ncbi:MAG: hypothetical protein GY697_24365, partial [Desulfobacterales bacterium]|nr:hypothetical protein [Desulfobacterales bacterium]
MTFAYNFHDLLTLRSNVDLAYIVLPADFIRPSPSCDQWDLSVWKVPNSRFDSSGCRQIAYGLHYNPRTDFLFSKINMLGVEVAWGIRNLLGTETELIFNGAFWRLCRYILQVPLSSVCQVSLIVKALLQLKLLFKGHTLISGAAAELNGRGIVFAGLSGAGKTTTLLNFLEAFPARYVSEDVFFLADRRMRSFPNPIKKARFGFTTLFYT